MKATFLAVLSASAACVADPVLEDQIAELGPEDPEIPIGPHHRPNQPCLVCHSEKGAAAGAASTIYSVAGTIYRDVSGRTDGMGDPPAIVWPVRVTLTDSKRVKSDWRKVVLETNCAGNFYVKPQVFDPVYPMWVDVAYGDEGAGETMISPIHREGSCGFCHGDPGGARSNGHVFVLPEGEFASMQGQYAPNGCETSEDK